MQLNIPQGPAAAKILKTIGKAKFELKLDRDDTVTRGTIETLRTRFLKGVRSPNNRDAPDPAAINLFERLRYKYSSFVKTPWSKDSKEFAILFDLHQHLVKLKAEPADEEGRMSGV
jgi:hypothetical protein